MKVIYSPEGDALYISFRESAVEHTEEVQEGILADYDADEQIVGIEVLDASRKLDNPAEMLFTVEQPELAAPVP